MKRTRIIVGLLAGVAGATAAALYQAKRTVDVALDEGAGVRIDDLPFIGATTIDVGGPSSGNDGPHASLVLHTKALAQRARLTPTAIGVGVAAGVLVLAATWGE